MLAADDRAGEDAGETGKAGAGTGVADDTVGVAVGPRKSSETPFTKMLGPSITSGGLKPLSPASAIASSVLARSGGGAGLIEYEAVLITPMPPTSTPSM